LSKLIINKKILASFEAFTEVMFQVEVLWAVTPCIVVVGNQRFWGPCLLHLKGKVTWPPQHYMASQPRRHRLESDSYLLWFIYKLCSVSEI